MDRIKFETEIVFGEGAITELPLLIKNTNAKKVLITYGGGSVKRNGIMTKAIELLNDAGIEYIEFGGIEPNPLHSTIDKAAQFGKDNGVDFILAIGGGSTTDASKIIATKMTNKWTSSWDFIMKKVKMKNEPIPMGAIVTLSATASENNNGSVVRNAKTEEKKGGFTRAPIFAIEDPTYTYTVSPWQTASGSFDIFSHLLEQFFGATPFDYSDNQIIGMLKTLMKNVPIALNDPKNFEARESLMITSSFALNKVINFKQRGSDWFVHQLEHAFSAIWDISHGAGLGTISYWYYEYGINNNPDFHKRATHLAKELFQKESAKDFVTGLRVMIDGWNIPNTFTKYDDISQITEDDMKKIINHTTYRGIFDFQDDELKKLIKTMI
ncbi:iron-containing alcohol dehydrogenase [Candidatus Mycoplasma mahonii]|uniref:iron-containing alcohol dehydrogenase n=1 Tax=Candidatus Mycoplasma mahonii TaxID=3004105 RepID=UPI0026EB51D7|nr:iron-containing alcohol dehydrogenase [Candidatus Mycoplasma mahonii]WKX02162.1 iron-containing alcohol dehydrogenase [Candidatus Mycoplasma mahonii]